EDSANAVIPGDIPSPLSPAESYNECPSAGSVSSTVRAQFTELLVRESCWIDLDQPVTGDLVNAIAMLHGVATALADKNRYRLEVTRGRLFPWNEVVPRIVAAIGKEYQADVSAMAVCHFAERASDYWGI
ncbi:MAG TPA: hypothetical protein VLB83_02440, partial [Candidatus Paceibacterota bacterium]|nr:hypothetical protein [Candidatus Paceibacterota bacterium]